MACFFPVTFVKYSVIKTVDIVYFPHQSSFQVALYAVLLDEELLEPAVINQKEFKI